MQLPVDGERRALHILLFEEDVDRGYDRVGPLTELLCEIPFAGRRRPEGQDVLRDANCRFFNGRVEALKWLVSD